MSTLVGDNTAVVQAGDFVTIAALIARDQTVELPFYFGLALLSLNAWLSSRKVLRASPALTLRESV